MSAKPKKLGACLHGAGVFVGVALLMQSSASAQTPIYSYGGGISGTSQFTDDGNGQENLTFSGTQTGPGYLGLTVYNAPTDPTLTFSESINNQSSFSWGQYVLTVVMGQTFTIGSATVTAPPGWSYIITQPTLDMSDPNYTGSIDYFVTSGGTPVMPSPSANDTLDFGYAVTFGSDTSFSITESAMVSPVPEPGAASILLVGGSLFAGWKLFKRRQAEV